MALGSAWKQMSWLYYQYLLVTALYMLEPWERTVFSILLPAARGLPGGELWGRVGYGRYPGAVAEGGERRGEAGRGGGALGVVRGELAGLQPARAERGRSQGRALVPACAFCHGHLAAPIASARGRVYILTCFLLCLFFFFVFFFFYPVELW